MSGVPMPGTEKATGRLVALVSLLVLAGFALRGYLPGDQHTGRERSTDNPASLFAVVAVLGVSVVIVAIALVAWLRSPRTGAPAAHDLPRGPGANGERPKWRFLLICLGAFLVWLLIVMLLLRLMGPRGTREPSASGPNAAPRVNGTARPPSPPAHTGHDVFLYLAATSGIMLLMLAIAAVVAIGRRAHPFTPQRTPFDDSGPAPAATGPESLALAAERGLAEIEDVSREPREAIIACYAAMERALADAPGVVPLASDTPSEVLARAVEHRAIHSGSATELVDLFAEARFSVHVMNEGHREAAVHTLQLVLAELRSVA
ncbi:MAG: hypothetical protein JWR32_2501 [Mycobacterium sp.]|nr:hypothetical protein [Mycobacterium sp.]